MSRFFPFGRKAKANAPAQTPAGRGGPQPVHIQHNQAPSPPPQAAPTHGVPNGTPNTMRPPQPHPGQAQRPVRQPIQQDPNAPIPLHPEHAVARDFNPNVGQSGIKGLTRAAPAEGRLTAIDLKKAYKNKEVVRGASVHVARGEAVGLLGPNGAGKTTMFYMITGLVPADSGHIHIDGHDVTALPMYQRSRLGISYLPQEASIFRGLTVEQNIMAVLQVVERSRKKRKERMEQLLDEFRITHKRHTVAMRLSGGERRRCEIARALASGPSYVLLDEPFAGVDPVSTQDIQNLVSQLTDLNIGVLITDHNVRETLEMTDRAYVCHEGQILTHGNRLDIINDEETRRVYLGDMYVQR